MPRKHFITLYEVESKGCYHEHWLASSHLDAARRAVSHAQECGQTLDHVDVSAMVEPEDAGEGGLVYVVNDTKTYAIEHGRVRCADPHDEPGARQQRERPSSDNRASKRAVPQESAARRWRQVDPRKGHRERQAQPKPTQSERINSNVSRNPK